MCLSYQDLRIEADLVRCRDIASRILHKDGLRDGQELALRKILSRRSFLGILETGAGKSLLYEMVALLNEGLIVVVMPILALIAEQVCSLHDFQSFMTVL